MATRQPALANLDGLNFESPEEREEFIKTRTAYLASQDTHRVPRWERVEPPHDEDFETYSSLENCAPEDIPTFLSQLIVIKLNGGRGLSLGLEHSKSRLVVSNDMTFMDIVVRQIEYLNDLYKVSIPLLLMNSFVTHEDSVKLTKKYENRNIKIYHFKQSRFPRMRKDTLNPCCSDGKAIHPQEWNPPGSGDVFRSLKRSGYLDKFMKEGKKFAFISNVENIGGIPGRVDFKLLNLMKHSENDFLLEVCERISTDHQGGILCHESVLPSNENENPNSAKERDPKESRERLGLLELSQVPVDKQSLFSAKKYKYWNTNSIWIRLDALDEKLKTHSLNLGIILKAVQTGSHGIVQFESPAATSIQSFSKAKLIVVPRYRYWDIKSTAALFLLQSNLYNVDPHTCRVALNETRQFDTIPLVRFGDTFRKFKDYIRRFKQIPDITELDHLTVSGDVFFGSGVVLKGTVIIVANHGERIDIPDGAILENNVISGSLSILDH